MVPVIGGKLFSVKEYQLIQSTQCSIQEFVKGVKLVRQVLADQKLKKYNPAID